MNIGFRPRLGHLAWWVPGPAAAGAASVLARRGLRAQGSCADAARL
ncbi:hypothetical protein FAIPA1_20138 [Frankia sp. AiPs1]|nr:hypothetical protein [Frankia sp. AiPa1]MCL9758019.1 hypothetical protein [Frankia sp. AiPa1]